MKCETAQPMLTEYLDGLLAPDRAEALAQHLNACASCAAQLAETRQLLEMLGSWPEAPPSARMRTRFFDMLEAYEAGRQDGKPKTGEGPSARVVSFPGNRMARVAAPLAAAAALLFLGMWLGREPAGTFQELPNRETALQTRRVSLNLMRHESAGERLAGVRYSTRLEQAEPEVIQALLQVLTNDENVNVRLAAVNALYRYREEPKAVSGLASALKTEPSPMVQLALIECLSVLDSPTAAEEMELLLHRGNVNPVVRERARESLGGLY